MQETITNAKTGKVTRRDLTAEEIEVINAASVGAVREQRNLLLKESDWTQLPDSQCNKELWAAYRALLRDVPQQEGFPNDIVWPDAPTQ